MMFETVKRLVRYARMELREAGFDPTMAGLKIVLPKKAFEDMILDFNQTLQPEQRRPEAELLNEPFITIYGVRVEKGN